jgi:hypothetical protein
MAAIQYFANIISAGSHVMEPYDLWFVALRPHMPPFYCYSRRLCQICRVLC